LLANSVKFAKFCKIFAIKVNVLAVTGSGCCSERPNSFGDKMAGQKKRKKIKPLIEKYGTTVSFSNVFETSVLV